MPKRCAIIGAGVSGLPSIRWALAYGIEPVAFELTKSIGGLWKYKPNETELGSVMKSTIINTSKEMTAYSDFPPPPSFANFMHNRQMLKYFQMYADHHQLHKYIRFEHTVLSVQRSPHYSTTGQWTLEYKTPDGLVKQELFDCVLLCQGHHAKPNLTGTDWKDHVGYEDTTNVVVGMGNSAVDVAVELSRIGKQVYLSTRRGSWIMNRVGSYGQPYDMEVSTRFAMKYTPTWLTKKMLYKRLQQRFDHAKFGLMPKHGILSQHATVNDELPNRIISGTVIVKPNIKEYTATGVLWEDGTERQVDNVILCTGYLFDFNLVENGQLIKVKDNYTPLFKYMYPAELLDHNTLGIIGLAQPLGSIMPISEMQARVFFEMFTGASKLPGKEAMLADIQYKQDQISKRYVDYVDFMDDLAGLIDCIPRPLDYIFTDPKLAQKLVFQANVAYVYRLRGNHTWSGARDAIMTVQKRSDEAFKGRDVGIKPSSNYMTQYVFASIFMLMPKRCAIIGAGVSGLPSIRWALAYGIEPVAFELTESIGGLWKYKPNETELSSVMKSTIINTSKEMTAYSDFPPPPSFANFMHNRQMLKYFQMYADHHQLHKYIRFEHTVLSVQRSPHYSTTGQWTLEYKTLDGLVKQELFDCVLLCQGHHAKPNLTGTDWKGKDIFQGKIIHSHSYKDHVGYEDTTNVVVGMGNSAVDVAVELSRIGKQVYLSTRRGAWILSKVGSYGQPYDMELLSRFRMKYFNAIAPAWLVEKMVKKQLQHRFDHAKYGVMPKHGVWSQHGTVSDELPNRIVSGTVIVKPNIKEYTATGVLWEDGTESQVDNVILCTGYLFDFNLVENGQLIKVKDNYTPLFKYMYPAELLDHNTLGIIGLIQPIGSIMPIAEMQARVFFEIFTGASKLPKKEVILDDIYYKHMQMSQRYVHSLRHTVQVDYIQFMDELAGLIDCIPRPLDYIFTDPKGNHTWSGARDAIMTVQKRSDEAFKGRDVGIEPSSNYATQYVFASIFMLKYIGRKGSSC
uniref:Flavin-containing monooxygenase n=1 Tax=Ditylenchus dipsaci TaxID=166011 RepID=A0A915EBX9_9BILA